MKISRWVLGLIRFLTLVAFAGCAIAQEGEVPRDGFALHYSLGGTGAPIIFLSGGPGLEVDYMKPAAELFPTGYQRVFLEQRGTGRSRPAKLTAENMTVTLMVEDLEELRSALKLERLILAGHSWGGMLAMAYAASHPERVDRLVLIDPGGPTLEFRDWFGDNISARLHPEDRELADYWAEQMKNGIDPDLATGKVMGALTPGYFFDRAKGLSFASSTPAKFAHRDASTLLNADMRKNYDLRPGLTKVTRPVLIIQGYQDPIGEKTAEDIHALIHSSTLHYIKKCGHFPWLEQPEAMRQIVADFLVAKQ
jgi:proline iminopeptidase